MAKKVRVTKTAMAAARSEFARLGGSANTPAQHAARQRNAKLAGPPRRVCDGCGQPVTRPNGRNEHTGHKERRLDAKCHETAWHWQTKSEQRAIEGA